MSGALTDTSILAGASNLVDTGDKSLRFNAADDSELTRSPGTPTSTQKGTISVWTKFDVKLSPAAPADYDWCGIISNYSDNDNRIYFAIVNRTADEYYLIVYGKVGGSANIDLRSTMALRDPSAWYHLVVSYDTTQVTAADRIKIYVNGQQVTAFDTETYPAQDAIIRWNGEANLQVGRRYAGGSLGTYSGYLAEVYFIDGTALTPSSFGQLDSATNQWIPLDSDDVIDAVTFGTNGFYLDFSNSAALGTDTSGNGNNFTATNLVATDQMLDAPTNNFATMNPLAGGNGSGGGQVLTEGNLKDTAATDNSGIPLTIGLPGSGKWYWEWEVETYQTAMFIGIYAPAEVGLDDGSTDTDGFWIYRGDTGNIYGGGANASYGNAWNSAGDIVGVAADMDNGAIYFAVNNTWQNSGVPTSGASKTGAAATDLLSTGYDWVPTLKMHNTSSGVLNLNCGQDSSFAGEKTAQGNQDGNDVGDFYYAPPTGYLALCEDNLPDPSIALPGGYFNTVLYTGTGVNPNAITGVGFAPDFVWVKAITKSAGNGGANWVSNTATGIYKTYDLGAGTSQGTDYNGLVAFGSDGFSVGLGGFNYSGDPFASWSWLGGTAPTVNNTESAGTTPTAGSVKINGSNLGSALAGNIAAKRLTANTTSGFSVVEWTGTGANATVAHGLSEAPQLVLNKADVADGWRVGTTEAGFDFTKILYMSTGLSDTSVAYWNNADPTSTVLSLGYDNGVNSSGNSCIAYCFHSVEGYSKVGGYTGNGSSDGTFIYTGFSPAWLMVKKTSASGTSWYLWDDKRNTYNENSDTLSPNTNANEAVNNIGMDFVSNGIKVRSGGSAAGSSGQTYLYVAFAESPFKTANAR